MKHFNVTFESDGKQISIHAGATILEAAGQVGIILNTSCGGKGTCEKCVVKIGPDSVPVLACQYQIQTDLTVTIPAVARYFEQKILAAGIDKHIKTQRDLTNEYPHLTDTENLFGVAVDIGTTTVVAKLINLSNGKCLATRGVVNPQITRGDDVIARINYAQTDYKVAELQTLIIDCTNELIADICSRANIRSSDIYEICVVANTTMNHIFLKLPIIGLGQAPYKAFTTDSFEYPAENLSLNINPAGTVYTVENIAGFVGSDTTSVALAVDIDSADEQTLIVDIGTNGEIVLGTKDRLYAASCAAGPAMEGARISCGSRAVEGAIEAVVINDHDIDFDVIGNCPPTSICGSGLIDAMAVMLELGIVDQTGRIVDPEKLQDRIPPAIAKRIIQLDGQPAFQLCDTESAPSIFPS